MTHMYKTAAAGALLLGLTVPAVAQSQQETIDEARVISSVPIIEQVDTPQGRRPQAVGYNVTYEFAGRRYNTRTAEPPGATLPVQVSPMGVTTSPVPSNAFSALPDDGRAAPDHITPEPGVVVGADASGQPTYASPRAYAIPAPAYVYPAPVYGGPAYYAAPYIAAPIGLSLNLGYSRGWGGHRGHWR